MFVLFSIATLFSCSAQEGDDMSTYPPDGWTLDTGGGAVWGEHVDIDTTVVRSGDASINFVDADPDSPVDVDLYSEMVPVEEGQPIAVEAWLRADSISAGNTLSVGLLWFDSSSSYIAGSYSSIFSGIMDAVDTWELKSGVVTAPANACYFEIKISGAKAGTDRWCDSVFARRVPRMFEAWLDVDSTLTPGTVVMDNETFDFGGRHSTVTGKYTALKSGPHSFSAYMHCNTSVEWWLSLEKGLVVGGTKTLSMSSSHSGTSNSPALSVAATNVWLEPGDTVYVTFDFDGTGDLEFGSGRFYGGELF